MPGAVVDRPHVDVAPELALSDPAMRVVAEPAFADEKDDVLVVVALVGAAEDGLRSGLGGFQPEGDGDVEQAVEGPVGQVDAVVASGEEHGAVLVAEAVLRWHGAGHGAVAAVAADVPGIPVERVMGYQLWLFPRRLLSLRPGGCSFTREFLHLGCRQRPGVYPEVVERTPEDLAGVEPSAKPVLVLAEDEPSRIDLEAPVLQVPAAIRISRLHRRRNRRCPPKCCGPRRSDARRRR